MVTDICAHSQFTYFVATNFKPKPPLKIKVVERKLGREGAVGQCWQGERLVEVDPRQPAKEYLDTVIHEILHELLPQRSEKFVLHAGNTLASTLWKLGYRRVDLK